MSETYSSIMGPHRERLAAHVATCRRCVALETCEQRQALIASEDAAVAGWLLTDMVESYVRTALSLTQCNGAVDHERCRGEDCDASLDALGFEVFSLSLELAQTSTQDCVDYVNLLRAEQVDHSTVSAEQMGRNLWLTRNRHGVGFWDAGLGELGDALTKWAHSMGGQDWTVSGDRVVEEEEGS